LNLIEIIILAIALGIDCFVVSISQGFIFKTNRIKNSLLLAVTMGFFQGFMPVLSYGGVHFVHEYIEPYANIIVFSIFMFLGLKFITDTFFEKEEKLCCIDLKCLLALGFATSIDALAAGINLKLTNSPLIISVLAIGLASFIMSVTGFWSGYLVKSFPTKILQIFGGLILIFLAIKAFL